jgi:hypothetical protein
MISIWEFERASGLLTGVTSGEDIAAREGEAGTRQVAGRPEVGVGSRGAESFMPACC